MDKDQMLAELREVVHDTKPDYAWADYTLLGYLAEGQDKFCEETGYFVDSSNYTITTTPGVANYAIPDRAISILDIWDGTRRLGHFQQSDVMASYTPGTPTYFNPGAGSDSYAWQADEATGMVTLYPVPTTTKTYQLRVWRYSRIDLADTNGEPELPTRFRRACIEWAAYKAYMHHDQEAQDPVKAADHKQAFDQYVSDGRKALRRIHAVGVSTEPNPIYRV